MSFQPDWGIIFTILGSIQLATIISCVSCQLGSTAFWVRYRDDKGPALAGILLIPLIPVMSQMCLVNDLFEAKRELAKKEKQSNKKALPVNLFELCHIIVKKQDYTVIDRSLVNKSVPLTIFTNGVTIQGKHYSTDEFREIVEQIIHVTEHSDILKIYKERRGV